MAYGVHIPTYQESHRLRELKYQADSQKEKTKVKAEGAGNTLDGFYFSIPQYFLKGKDKLPNPAFERMQNEQKYAVEHPTEPYPDFFPMLGLDASDGNYQRQALEKVQVFDL